MILLIDIGNSNICLGVYKQEQMHTYRMKSFVDKSSDEYYLLLKNFITESVEDVIISSVVPQITSAFVKLSQQYFEVTPYIVGQKLKTGIQIVCDDPKTVGADLICDVVAAAQIFDEGLVIDLGTASKFLYYKNKTYLGAVIAPGVAVSTKAMVSSAALLPHMELVVPAKVLNTATIPCMQSGVLYGFASMVDGLIQRIKDELKQPHLKIIATGGLISLIAPLCKEKIEQIEPDLVLKGLLQIYLKNKN